MEWKIGEIKQINGEWYQCIVGCYCPDCAFYNNNCEERERITLGNKLTKEETTGFCTPEFREDGKSVIFKKLKKVGGFIITKGRIFQKLTFDNNSCKECVFNVPNKACCKNSYIEGICDDNGFWIEIKQNKGNMEEKKQKLDDLVGLYTSAKITYKEFDEKLKTLYADKEECKSSLKEFDLEAAKAGKPVCTRNGRKARIICFDKQNDYYPIIALVTVDEKECIFQYTNKGEYLDGNDNTRCNDLIMFLEKKEGWVNVYKGLGCISVYPRIYKSRDEAVSDNTAANRIDTVKITWEE